MVDDTKIASQFGQPNDDPEVVAERIWKKCEILVDEATSDSVHLREQGSVLLRWSITTCLTINAGALVAIINATNFDADARLWSGVCFLGGTLLALAVSMILASAYLRMSKARGLVAKKVKTAIRIRDLEILEDLDMNQGQDGEALGGFALFLAGLSIVAFVFGAYIMIEGAL